MIIAAKLAERVQRRFRQVFWACATPGSLARRRLLEATSASWLWRSFICLVLLYPLPYLTPLACTLLFCAIVFSDTTFSHDTFFTQRFIAQTLRRNFNESNYHPHYRRHPFRHLCHHYRVAAQEHGVQT
jgi:hypothetical protein